MTKLGKLVSYVFLAAISQPTIADWRECKWTGCNGNGCNDEFGHVFSEKSKQCCTLCLANKEECCPPEIGEVDQMLHSCRWTGCSSSDCNFDEVEVRRSDCPPIQKSLAINTGNNELCCKPKSKARMLQDLLAKYPNANPTLDELTVLGTHHSPTNNDGKLELIKGVRSGISCDDDFPADCQKLSINDQFNAGVRAFNIRPMCLGNGELRHYHGEGPPANCIYDTLENVFEEIRRNLLANPSEVAMMLIENFRDFDNENCRNQFNSLLRNKFQTSELQTLRTTQTKASRPPRPIAFFEQELTWQDAQDYCRKTWTPPTGYKGELAGYNAMTLHEFEDMVALAKGKTFWIGLNDESEENNFQFSDGSGSPSFTRWAPNEPNGNRQENCVVVYSNGLLNDLFCTERRSFICQGVTNNDGSLPTKAFDTPKTWAEARHTCMFDWGLPEGLSGDLASATTSNDLAQLVSLLPGKSFWLSTNDEAEEGVWRNADGSKSQFTPWEGSEPNGGRGENCVEAKSNGKWNDLSCSNHRLPFICKAKRVDGWPRVRDMASARNRMVIFSSDVGKFDGNIAHQWAGLARVGSVNVNDLNVAAMGRYPEKEWGDQVRNFLLEESTDAANKKKSFSKQRFPLHFLHLYSTRGITPVKDQVMDTNQYSKDLGKVFQRARGNVVFYDYVLTHGGHHGSAHIDRKNDETFRAMNGQTFQFTEVDLNVTNPSSQPTENAVNGLAIGLAVGGSALLFVASAGIALYNKRRRSKLATTALEGSVVGNPYGESTKEESVIGTFPR